MKRIGKRIVCVLLAAVLLGACAFSAFAANEYMLNAHWKAVVGSEATQMLENGDTFVLFCYRATCGNSKYIGAKVLEDWMDTYGKDVYGVDVDGDDGTPAFVWAAMNKTSGTLPFVAFVRDGVAQAFSPEDDLVAYADMLNDTFFTFYTDVTRVSLSVETTPDKTVYNTGEPLDTTGMTLRMVCADGSEEIVKTGYTCVGFSSDEPGHKTVTVRYRNLETKFTAVVNTPDGKPAVWVVQPAKDKLRYGNTTTLTADFCNLPEDVQVEWTYAVKTIRGIRTVQGTGPRFGVKADGFTQKVTVTAAATTADGSPILNANGEAVVATHTIRFQNNIFFRLQFFFENLFNRSGCGSEI